jgi:putative nucleotidyltransferase-like protein
MALKGALDWDRLLGLAEAHGVRPQLIRTLQALNWVGVPSNVKSSLLSFLNVHNAYSLLLAKELILLNDRFSKNAIRFAAFKGPSLAYTVYGDLSLRECTDIDVIVEQKQVAAAEAVLSSIGYRAVQSSSFRAAFLSYTRQCSLVREEPRVHIDLHWDFTASYATFPLSPTEIWSGLEDVDIGGRSIPTLNQTDLALFLAGHGNKERWRCLKWIADFAMLIERCPVLDWKLVLDRARRRGCGRSILVGYQLAAQLLGTRVDRDLLKEARDDLQARSAVKDLVRRISNEYPIPASERQLVDFDLCETKFQKARAIGRLLITRTAGDYMSMPLPRLLWPMYYVTRPFRLAGKAIKATLAHEHYPWS